MDKGAAFDNTPDTMHTMPTVLRGSTWFAKCMLTITIATKAPHNKKNIHVVLICRKFTKNT